MNRFAIEEDDQFEIAAIDTVNRYNEKDMVDKVFKAMQAIENLTKQQKQGMDYFYHYSENRTSVFLASIIVFLYEKMIFLLMIKNNR